MIKSNTTSMVHEQFRKSSVTFLRLCKKNNKATQITTISVKHMVLSLHELKKLKLNV